MLIVSKFHDYYDVGMNQGIDKTVVYVRDTVKVKGEFPSLGRHSIKLVEWFPCVLAFCGEYYPFVYRVNTGKIDMYIWDVEEAVEAVGNVPKNRWDPHSIHHTAGLREFFEKKYPQLDNIYHERKAPIFGFNPFLSRRWSYNKDIKYETLVINPNLKEIQFYKVIDPITAFQKVYMFISGVIGVPEKSTVKITDEVMAASKGHDGKYSFRKQPGKRGKNKWR